MSAQTVRDTQPAFRKPAPQSQAPAQPAIRLSHINKSYSVGDDDLLALDDVSVDIGGGQFVAVVGPSGCGKSTLLRVLAGLIPASSGELLMSQIEI